MLQLEHITWTTPEGTGVLRDLDLTVPDGELVVVTGPNGGGKTTLAKIIAGLVQPDSGRILLDGQDITALGVTERAKLGVSFAFQQPVRFKGITVRRLIELASGNTLSEQQLCDVLIRVGLCAREYIDREVNATLSGGEIKRIEIASVLARHTRLSIFDEPEAGIDLWSFNNLVEVFSAIRREQKGTTIIISHQERILRIADRICVVSQGKVKAMGKAADMMDRLTDGSEVFSGCTRQEAAR